MATSQQPISIWQEIVFQFIPHLRWHYQVGILSAAYLLALLYFPRPDWQMYLLQFLNVHLLLYGGATAFNSFWDKDEGPVGGLRNPPPMREWMRIAALGVMGIGILLASTVGVLFLIVYIGSCFLFWGYSSPVTRWKGRPLVSIIVIGVSTGMNSFILGCLAAGAGKFSLLHFVTGLGVAGMLVALYPISQIYQRNEDQTRGDQTFAVCYGIEGVRTFFTGSFIGGGLLLSGSLWSLHSYLGLFFLAVSISVGGWISHYLKNITGRASEYAGVMRVKYMTSIAFNLFIIFSWAWIYYF